MSNSIKVMMEELLIELGDTPEEIRNSLRTKGVRGIPNWSCRCPLANYLREGLPNSERSRVEVCEDVVAYIVDNANTSQVNLTEGQIKFIQIFDSCAYADLIDDSVDG